MCKRTSKILRITSLSVFYLLCAVAFAQATSFQGQRDPFVSVSDSKHSGGAVYDILQDGTGFIWMATDKGLLRYDGNSLLSAAELDSSATWLDRMGARSLSEDSQGRIWVVHQEGIALWDKRYQAFRQIPRLNGLKATSIEKQGVLQFWIGTEDGLYFFDARSIEDRPLEKLLFISESQDKSNRNFITSLYLDPNELLWVGTSGGLFILETRTRNIHEVVSDSDSLAAPYISFIEQDEDGSIWAGTRESGLIHIRSQDVIASRDAPEIEYYDQLPSRQLLSVSKTSEGQFYIGSANKGVFLWDPILKQVVPKWPLSFSAEATMMSSKRVLSLFSDRSNLLWVGTASGTYKSTQRPVLSTGSAMVDSMAALGIKHVKTIIRDAGGHLWMGSFGDGVIRIHGQSGEYIHYKREQDAPNSLVDDRVLAIDIDKRQRVWILTSGGISQIDLDTNTFSTYLESNNVSIFSENIIFQDIFVSANNEVWVSTSYDGLLKYNEDLDDFEPWALPSAVEEEGKLLEIRQIMEDSEGSLWFAAGRDGVFRYNPGEATIQKAGDFFGEAAASLQGKEIVSLGQTSKGEIWAGTLQAGVFKMDPKTKSVISYDRQDGLPGNEITCILEDRKGYIWLLVRDGLARYDTQQDRFLKFDEHDGLISTQYYYDACLMAGDQFYVGNNAGVEQINLNELNVSEVRPTVQLASLHIMNKPVHHVDEQKSIQLEDDSNYIRFQFFIPDYLDPDENQIMYKLINFDADWKVAPTGNVIAFEDLPPGMHQLFVKGVNHRGIWSEPQIYTIQVAAIEWAFWGGLGLGSLLFIGGMGIAQRYRDKYLGRIKDLESEKLTLQDESELSVQRTKAEIARDLHDDMGADLSRLVLSLENRLQRDDLSDFSLSWTQECWEYAQRVTREVRFLSWSVDPDRNWLPDLVDGIYREAHDTFEVDGIQFVTSKIPNIHLPSKVRKNIFLIFREALTNIIHHASAQRLKIQVNYKKKMLEIIIEDDGVGFDVDNVVEGNGLSNMRKRANDLKANLFWESKRGNGTKVVFQCLVA